MAECKGVAVYLPSTVEALEHLEPLWVKQLSQIIEAMQLMPNVELYEVVLGSWYRNGGSC